MSQPTIRVKPGLLDIVAAKNGIKSDEALAKTLGVSRATLDRVKHGRNAPSPLFQAALIRLTRMRMDSLFEVTEDLKQTA